MMAEAIRIAEPGPDDGERLHRLVSSCPPLDVNSIYAYYLIVRHHPHTTRLAWAGSELVGAVTGYRLPDDPAALFVWQVAVARSHRGRSLALRLLVELVRGCGAPEVRKVVTTIGPENRASNYLFDQLASVLKTTAQREPFLPANVCGPGHDAEHLVTVGPFFDTRQPQPEQEASVS